MFLAAGPVDIPFVFPPPCATLDWLYDHLDQLFITKTVDKHRKADEILEVPGRPGRLQASRLQLGSPTFREGQPGNTVWRGPDTQASALFYSLASYNRQGQRWVDLKRPCC